MVLIQFKFKNARQWCMGNIANYNPKYVHNMMIYI
jgi:hypothetical protein